MKIALVDDHEMMRNGLAEMLQHKSYTVLFEASNGEECIAQLNENNLPDIILMDINMPKKNGMETTSYIKQHFPSVKVLALSMFDHEDKIIKMLRAGACGYLLKDSSSKELIQALETIKLKGFYSTEQITSKLIKGINDDKKIDVSLELFKNITDRELQFLKLCCTEMGYKEIANEMEISTRTVDGYRESLFEKLEIHTRVGLVLFAIKNNIFIVN